MRTLLVRIGIKKCGAIGRFTLCCRRGFGAVRGLILTFLKATALLL
jgi:hypothetical protein